jgi:4a-hydroxytetrahydrobiopterin dehydratase
MTKLAQADIDQKLAALPEWSVIGDALQRTFGFPNFVDAMTFVNRVADLAERQQHHPDILVRYNKVTLTLSTHDAGGLTDKDFALAAEIDGLTTEPKPKRSQAKSKG